MQNSNCKMLRIAKTEKKIVNIMKKSDKKFGGFKKCTYLCTVKDEKREFFIHF